MTRKLSYYHQRYGSWRDNDVGLNQLIRENRHEQSWENLSDFPAVRVTTNFDDGLFCLYARDVARARVFLCRAIRNADRMIAEQRYLDTELAKAGHPMQLAVIMRGRAYASWLLGERLDRRTLRQVAEYIVTFCRTKTDDRKSFTDSMTMNDYLQAVRAAMIASDLDYAGELLKVQDRFRWHHAQEFELWRQLVRGYPDVTDSFEEKFEAFFDLVRDPDFSDADEIGPVAVDRDTLALETGIIREMYIVSTSALDPIDPQAVIEAIAH